MSTGSQRYETFTEAVPLSLSSMAHMNIPLRDGVIDGIRQVISHMLLSCVNYARIVHPPHSWSFGDLTTSKFAWYDNYSFATMESFPLVLLMFTHSRAFAFFIVSS